MGNRNHVHTVLRAARFMALEDIENDDTLEVETTERTRNNRPTFNRPDDWN